MPKAIHHSLVLRAIGILVVCIWEVGHAAPPSTVSPKETSPMQKPPPRQQDKARVAWDSPRMFPVEQTWKTGVPKVATPLPGLLDYERFKMMIEQLKRDFSPAELRELATSCRTMPLLEEDRRLFVRVLLQAMTWIFVTSGNRDDLVLLLSTQCPPRIGHDDIEFYLVLAGKKLKDPILVLGEAYTRCQVPEVRLEIAAAVRRGFCSYGIPGKNDAEFVGNAMQWYERNKKELVFNIRYGYNARASLDYSTHPLFNISKPSKATE